VRQISQFSDRVVLVVAGYAIELNQIGQPLWSKSKPKLPKGV
jgi:hypothetical protein